MAWLSAGSSTAGNDRAAECDETAGIIAPIGGATGPGSLMLPTVEIVALLVVNFADPLVVRMG
jgi:hypothetical protein